MSLARSLARTFGLAATRPEIHSNMAETATPAYKRILHNLRNMPRDQRTEFGIYFGVTFSLWFVGHMHFSFAWIVMILVVFVSWQYQMEEKKKRRNKMKKAFTSSFMEKIQNLPSWVYFSETEKADWLNQIMAQMWPYVGEMVEKIMKETVEPEMQKNMPSALSTLYFEKITLGADPPRVGEVKAYQSGDMKKKDEFIFDLDISYCGDAQVKLSVKNVKLGINNIELKGVLRVIFKPLVSDYNPVGGVTVFFLNRPKLKFDLTNLLNVLDIPGLKSTLRRITDDVIASFVVLPNRVVVPLAQGVDASDLQYPIPEGVLRIKVLEAKDLKAKDVGLLKKGKSDPYTTVAIGAQKFRTKVVDNNLNPEWNETFEAFVDNHEGQELEIIVYDEDRSSKDSKIGSLETDIASVVEQGRRDLWLPLKGVKQGRIHLQLSWLSLDDSARELSQESTDPGTAVAALVVKPISAHHLPGTSSKNSALRSVYVEVTVGKTTQKTFHCSAEKIEWKQALRFLVVNPQADDAEIKVIEAKGTKTLGHLTFSVRSLLNKPGLAVEKSFPLVNSGGKSNITCRFTLRILKVPDAEASTGSR